MTDRCQDPGCTPKRSGMGVGFLGDGGGELDAVQRCFTSTETVRTITVLWSVSHFHFHAAPEL